MRNKRNILEQSLKIGRMTFIKKAEKLQKIFRIQSLKSRDRQRKLVAKIDEALARIENGSYGYCEVTGEPINIERLDARPVTTQSIEAQEMHERNEKLHSDDQKNLLTKKISQIYIFIHVFCLWM